MISLDDLQSHSALTLLENYEGINPYLRGLRNEFLKNKKIKLTDTQNRYIVENHQKAPILINRLIAISSFLGEELQKQNNLPFIPLKIKLEYILAETDKAFHVYGKVTQKQVDSKMYWLPKTQVLDDPYFEDIGVDINLQKYNDILAKTGKKLFDHQEKGIPFLVGRKGAILADDMGLGKSIQAIIAALESGAQKILIVCPSSVKINWEREIKAIDPTAPTTIVDGFGWRESKFTIINFDILKNFHTRDSEIKKATPEDPITRINRQLVNAKFDLVIVDEAHNLKNKNSIRGEIMVELVDTYGIDKVWLLTGTPVANRPMDFFNLLKLIKAPIADNWKYFVQRYCDGRQIYRTQNGFKKKIWLTSGASNLDELASKTKNLMLRRLKTDVLDMPDKIITPMYHELTASERLEYEDLWEEYLLERKKKKKRGTIDRSMVELILLRKFVAMKAIPKTIEMVEEAIAQDRKVIVFTNFTDELMELAEHFGNIAVIHNGEMSTKTKQSSVDNFQNKSKIKVFIGNIKSAGVGITLTEGTVIIFNSYDWVTGNNEQAEDRAYRIGQKNDVNIYYQLFLDTISVRMWETLHSKKEVINTILGESVPEEDKVELMMDLLFNEENT